MDTSEKEWYYISNAMQVDSPALVIYPDRIKENIRLLKSRVANVLMLRPHVKTNKIAEVCQLMMDEGISKFKCATIAEAEMLAQLGAPDVLLAYQPVGPKVQRLTRLMNTYPLTLFSCLIDDAGNARFIDQQCAEANTTLNVFIDLNVGMNRTGISPADAFDLFRECLQLSHISPAGLHSYDGHITDTDIRTRQQRSDEAFFQVEQLSGKIFSGLNVQPVIIAGGSPAFATHLSRQQVEFSPGTFVFWDWGYKHRFPEEPYDYAALVLSRVISIIDANTVCTDLGHKSVAAENPFPRVHFLNAPDASPVSQSEEHLVLSVPDAAIYSVGDLLYGVPVHICPTVALYEQATVVENKKAVTEWEVVARKRRISV